MLNKIDNFYYFIMIFPIVLSIIMVPIAFGIGSYKKALNDKHIEGIHKGYSYKQEIEDILAEEEIENTGVPHKKVNIKLIRKNYEKLNNSE